jgi:2-hydroxychromene-2-carboxylate isomerase
MNATQVRSPIEFWFDFASGYAYFAALEIEALAERHGRSVLWRPFTLGAAFKVTGAQGLSRTPLKGEYARRDWQRLARLKGVVFKLPERHPKVGLAAIRAFYHIDRIDPPAAAAWPNTSSPAISKTASIPTIPMRSRKRRRSCRASIAHRCWQA